VDVLLTGATGYVGGRLLRAFEEEEAGQTVRCLARRPGEVAATRRTTEVVQGDCLDEASLEGPFKGVDTAYYLVHSMNAGKQFAERDRCAATNFGRAAARAGVRRIVYLGGLADDVSSLSTHLKSRAETGDALRASGVPVIEFRASIVVGSGSLSFEIVRALVERLPVMICPRWVETLAQPIAIDDVVAYLRAALHVPGASGQVFEIGGPEVVSYGDLMRRYARLRGLRRLLLPVPVLSPRLSGMWLALVTPAQARVGRALVEGLRNPSVVRSYAARELFTIEPMPLDAALAAAMDDIAGPHWKVDTRTVAVNVPPARAFAPIRRIGGSAGWYYGGLLWKTRALIDRWMGGIGMDGRRRDPDQCTVGDVIDGWTVDLYEPDGRMRLLAGLKLPGRGWLEFAVTPLDGGRRSRIRQTARFDPKGALGRAYWYAVLPFHAVIFRGLLRRIAQLAERGEDIAKRGLFVHRSVVAAPAAAVFRWHERPDALEQLMPPGRLVRRLVRIEHRAGGVRDGGRVTLSIGLGPVRLRWEARHYGYVRGKQFCDEQVRGPFRTWRHTHRVEAIGTSESLYEDRVEYRLRGGALAQALFDAPLRLILARVFAQRHRTVQARVSRRPAALAGSEAAAARSRIPRRAHPIACFAVLTLGLGWPPNAVPGQELPAVRTVASVDLHRYAGDWYEVARFPNWFQRQCVSDVRARYTVRPDGRLDVLNQCQTEGGAIDARGVARVVDTRTLARLKVRFAPAALSFLPFVWGDYWILGLAGDYSWAVVGSPDRNYLWILARTRELPSPAFTAAVDVARANGFDAGRLVGTDAARP
jgi:uncharacterized protein YbjT (DUF2867 family)/lipocalin/ligand-binding SRPBCC domain-containing protein